MERTEKVNWVPVIFLSVYQALVLITLPFYFYYATVSLSTVVAMIVLLHLTGMSITAGYHRFYSHRAYRVNPIIEMLLFFFGTMACQGSILRWSYDHRIHHAHVDTDDDPYSIKKGFWYAHCTWLLEQPRKIDPKVVPDLMRNKMVMFQHHYYPILMVVTNFMAWAFCGWLLDDYLGSLVLVVGLRMFLLHHFTWFINSLAHTWGDKPFCEEQSAVDNYLISLVTFGEGYHNYHHTFANDYRNGVRWYHYDPSKWMVWTLEKIGLAQGLKRMDPYTIKKRMVLERKNLLLDQIKELWYIKKEELEQKIQQTSDQIIAHIAEFKKLKERYRELKRQHSERDLIEELRTEMRQLKKKLQQDWREWRQLSSSIMRMRPLEA